MESSSLKRPVADPEGPILELLRVTWIGNNFRLGLPGAFGRQIEQVGVISHTIVLPNTWPMAKL